MCIVSGEENAVPWLRGPRFFASRAVGETLARLAGDVGDLGCQESSVDSLKKDRGGLGGKLLRSLLFRREIYRRGAKAPVERLLLLWNILVISLT